MTLLRESGAEYRRLNTAHIEAMEADLTELKRRQVMRTSPQTQQDERQLVRLSSGLTDLDFLLGGSSWASEQGFQSSWGFVRPSVAVIAGVDGVGRTTLMLQVAANVSRKHGRVLYVSGSESAMDLRRHAERASAVHENVFISPGANLDEVERQLWHIEPAMLVLDSMRTMQVPEETEYGSDRHLNRVASFAKTVSQKHNVCVVMVTSKMDDGSSGILLPEEAYELMDVILVLHKRTRGASELEWHPNDSPLICRWNRLGPARP